jgi:UDP-N-acetylmuramate: L-alanyl-gamma-D-glutamyl-meso-diaminopimelate ligase
VGGVPRDFDESYRLGGDDAPFVIEGDEYDCAFFEKKPKFWRYHPYAAILTSLEHDHIDIYPDMESYRAAFEGFVERMDEKGVLVAWAGDPEVREVAKRARSRVVWYALDGEDTGDVTPTWLAAEVAPQGGAQPFDLFVGGTSAGRIYSPLSGRHNLKNAVAAMALAAETTGVAVRDLAAHLRAFRGVRRRQELIGVAGGVRIYEDFAHHPTAVRETLAGLRARHPEGRLFGVFEPRSATASRNLHQAEYPDAFRAADVAILAPVGRPEIGDEERLDVEGIAEAITARGRSATAAPSIDAIVEQLRAETRRGDTVVLMSNGAFGGIYDRVLVSLATR